MRFSLRSLGLMAAMLAVLGGCAFSSTVEGEGEVISVRYGLPTLNKIDIGGSAKVNLIQSDQQELVVHAQENIIDELVIDIRDGELSIQTERGVRFDGWTDITYDLYVADVSQIELGGSLDLQSEGFVTARLELEFGGSIDAVLHNLDVEQLTIEAGGSADVELSGRATQFAVSSGGSADIDALELQAQDVTIKSAGSASMKVWAEQSLNVKAAGSANIRYKGRPLVEQSAAGSARVYPRNE